MMFNNRMKRFPLSLYIYICIERERDIITPVIIYTYMYYCLFCYIIIIATIKHLYLSSLPPSPVPLEPRELGAVVLRPPGPDEASISIFRRCSVFSCFSFCLYLAPTSPQSVFVCFVVFLSITMY